MMRLQERIGDFGCRTGVRRSFAAASMLCAASLMPPPAGAAAPEPISLAVFDFELEDSSAGASYADEAPADATQLANVTGEVRRLLEQSGRYRLVDVGGAGAAAANAHKLHDCNGCDSAVALKLGAEQSLVGVVKRVSRTEYTVRFQIRDARTGSVIRDEDSGLRMGADYSWSRGAARLVKDRLLQGGD
jgi:hypothetical protein